MKIIEPNVELWTPKDNISHVAKCARVCYGKESGDDKKLIDNLIKKKHYSMFRHESIYSIIPIHHRGLDELYMDYINCPYVKIHIFNGDIYVVTNKNYIIDNYDDPFTKIILLYQVNENIFSNTEIGFNMMRYTFCVTTQISTSRELNRVSPNNISERSTRYVYEDGTICKPWWLNEYSISQGIMGKYYVYKNGKEDDDINHKVLSFILACDNSFNTYKYLVDSGLSRQDARGVLPLDTATKCVYTYSIKEWRNIINLRYYGTTGAPHPNAKIIAGMIRNKLIELGYEFKN